MGKYQTSKEKAAQGSSSAVKNTSRRDQMERNAEKSGFNPFLSAAVIAPILSIIIFLGSIGGAFRLFKKEESIALVFNYTLSVLASGFCFWALAMLEYKYLGRSNKSQRMFVCYSTYVAFVVYVAFFHKLWQI